LPMVPAPTTPIVFMVIRGLGLWALGYRPGTCHTERAFLTKGISEKVTPAGIGMAR